MQEPIDDPHLGSGIEGRREVSRSESHERRDATLFVFSFASTEVCSVCQRSHHAGICARGRRHKRGCATVHLLSHESNTLWQVNCGGRGLARLS